MKRILSLVMVLTMLATFVPFVASAEAVTFEELSALASVSTATLSSSWTKAASAYATHTKVIPIKKGRTGKFSIYIEGQKVGADNQSVNLVYTGTIPAGTYQVEYWLIANNIDHVNGSWRMGTFDRYASASHTKGETDANGWTKFTSTNYTVAADTQNLPIIGMKSNAGDPRAIIVDDIAIKNVTTGEYLTISDAGFESTVAPITFDDLEEMAGTSALSLPSSWGKADGAYAGSSKVVPINKGRTGDYAVYIKGQTAGGDNQRVDLTYTGTIPAGTYTLEFWAMQNANCFNSWRFAVGGDQAQGNHTIGETDAAGWTKVTKTITFSSDVTNQAIAGLVGNSGSTRAVVVDDITLKNTQGVDVLTDGSFESLGNTEEPEEPKVYTFDDLEAMAGTSTLSLPSSWGKADGAYAGSSKVIAINAGRTGDYAVYIKGQTAGADNARVDLTYTGAIPAGTYTLEFWAMQNANCFGAWRFAVGGDQNNGNHTVGETDETGWTKITKTITLGSDVTSLAIAGLVGNSGSTRAVVIDDVTLKNAQGVDVLTDGGFESLGNTEEPEEPKVYTFDELEAMAGTSDLETSSNWGKADTAYGATSKVVPINAGRTGDYSVYIKGHTSATGDARVDLVYKGTIPAGTYTLEFWAMQNANCFGAWRFAVGGEQTNGNHSVGETDEAGWTKITKTITLASDVTSLAIAGLVGNSNSTRAVVVDDVTLKNAQGVDILTDGGFELSHGECADLINVAAYPVQQGGAVNISWINPDVDGISEIKVYANEVDKAVVPSLEANAVNECLVTGLSNNSEYTIKVVAKMNNARVESTVKATPKASDASIVAEDWTISTVENAKGNSGCAVLNSNAGLVNISGNILDGASVSIGQDLALDPTKKYQLRIFAKVAGVSGLYVDTDGNEYDLITTATTADTAFYTCDITGATTVQIVVDGLAGMIEIYDAELYEYTQDESGYASKNLFENPSFDEAATIPALQVSEAVFKLNGRETESLDESGTLQVVSTIKNNRKESSLSLTEFVAIYDGNELYNLSIAERQVNYSSEDLPGMEFTTNIAIPELSGGEYNVKVFYWENTTTLKPLTASPCEIAE